MIVKLIIVCDNRLLLHLLMAQLRSQPERFDLLAGLEDPQETLEAVTRLQPDLLLYDIDSDPDVLIHVLGQLRELSPATRVLLLSLNGPNARLDEALLKGASGFLDHTASLELLLKALEKVHEGQIWIDRTMTARLFVQLTNKAAQTAPNPLELRYATLTEREREIADALTRYSDSTRKVVATHLNISESTLRNHMTAVFNKLGVSNRNGLLAFMHKLELSERVE